MRRREFFAVVGATAVGWPLTVHAQDSIPTVGFMSASSHATVGDELAAFEAALKAEGFVEGQNLALEYRFAGGQFDRMQGFISDLIRRKVSVLVAGSPEGALIAKRATTTIPIVFSVGADPVAIGLVPSLNQPGSNVTGVYQFSTGLEEKRLGLLHEMVPKVGIIGVLIDPNYSGATSQLNDVQEAAAHPMPMRRASSTRPSPHSLHNMPVLCWFVLRHFSILDDNSLLF